MNEKITPDTDLLYEVRDGIGRIVFNRPQARNALTFGMYERLAAICAAAAGDRRLKEIIFTARLIEAEEAAGIGLLHEVVADLPALEKRTDELARLVASHAPLTLRATKQSLLRAQPKPAEDEDLILMCYQSRDFRE